MEKILVIGSLNLDYAIRVTDRPQPGETVLGHGLTLSPGGKGGNQAFTIGRFGRQTAMIGAVGDDAAGQMLRANLQRAGVDTDAVETLAGTPSGQAFIHITDQGENSITVIPGANAQVTPEMIGRHLDKMEDCDAVVMQLEIPLPAVIHAARRARALGKTVVLDPAPAVPDLPEELLSQVDILKPNETELHILTGLPTDTDEQVIAAARTLLTKGVGVVTASLGGRGVMMVTRDTAQRFTPPPVHVVDSTAAGTALLPPWSVCITGQTCPKACNLPTGWRPSYAPVPAPRIQSPRPKKFAPCSRKTLDPIPIIP